MAQLLESIPADLSLDVSAGSPPHRIVRGAIFDRDIADCAVGDRPQEKLVAGFGALTIRSEFACGRARWRLLVNDLNILGRFMAITKELK